MSLVGMKAPVFSAPAVVNGNQIVENFSLEQFIGKKNVVFFFYPKDFTFVCPTELLAFQAKLREFEMRDVAVVGCSTDTEETHQAWLDTPIEKGGIQGVEYPLVADTSKTIAANYDVLGGVWDIDDEKGLVFEGTPVAYRGLYLIDKEGIVRHETVNDLPLGRNIDEVLRVVDMWQFVEENGDQVCCPANWEMGKDAMIASKQGVQEYLQDSYSTKSGKKGCCGGGCGSDDKEEGGCGSGGCGSHDQEEAINASDVSPYGCCQNNF